MDGWNTYRSRLGVGGELEREYQLRRTQDYIARGITRNLSYQHVTVNDIEQDVAIIDKDDFDEKRICSMPGESLSHGGLVLWDDTRWLITEIDAHDEVYARGTMQRCNYELKWINTDGELITKWAIVEDGTKYLIGEQSKDIMTVGDARIAVTVGKDADTSRLDRGMRFLIDDLDSEAVLCYEISKPNKLFNVYDGAGVFRFILGETNVTDNDNVELRIADYYSWHPKAEKIVPDDQTGDALEDIVENAKEEEETKADRIADTKGWL